MEVFTVEVGTKFVNTWSGDIYEIVRHEGTRIVFVSHATSEEFHIGPSGTAESVKCFWLMDGMRNA